MAIPCRINVGLRPLVVFLGFDFRLRIKSLWNVSGSHLLPSKGTLLVVLGFSWVIWLLFFVFWHYSGFVMTLVALEITKKTLFERKALVGKGNSKSLGVMTDLGLK